MAEFKVSITQRAFSSISEHMLFVRNVSLEAAKELYEKTMTSFRSLSSFPERYPEIQDLRIAGARIRKMPIHNGRYVALYKVDGERCQRQHRHHGCGCCPNHRFLGCTSERYPPPQSNQKAKEEIMV